MAEKVWVTRAGRPDKRSLMNKRLADSLVRRGRFQYVEEPPAPAPEPEPEPAKATRSRKKEPPAEVEVEFIPAPELDVEPEAPKGRSYKRRDLQAEEE